MIEYVHAAIVLAAVPNQAPVIPNPAPVAPPGAAAILQVVANAKWIAGISLLVAFFVGLIVWAGGRWIDHHRAGRVGLVMMLCGVGGALLYGIGYQLISHFAAGG